MGRPGDHPVTRTFADEGDGVTVGQGRPVVGEFWFESWRRKGATCAHDLLEFGEKSVS